MASAVPQEPAPSTATGSCAMSLPAKGEMSRKWRRVATPPPTASVDRALRRGLGGLLLQAAREQLVEVDRRQHEVREATLRHEIRHGDTRVREEHVRADGADRATLVVGGQAAHREQAGLLHFDEERRGFTLLG